MNQDDQAICNADRIGLNYIRPDVNRPGNFDFTQSTDWLVEQYIQMGVKWNRVAFSWVLVQPEKDTFQWEVYDRLVQACDRANINILATLGGHFDRPPVPKWAGDSLADVVKNHPDTLEKFMHTWVERYHKSIQYWEMLNEPRNFHKELNVEDYVERILKPGHAIVKTYDKNAKVLPCAYNHLPLGREPQYFWDVSHDLCDIHNYHQYQNWGYFLTRASAEGDEQEVRAFRGVMEKYQAGDRPFWITETGWWGNASPTGSIYDIYKRFPGDLAQETKPVYSGREMLNHPIVIREDVMRADWLQDLFPRLFSIPGCEKAFLWVSMDEFEGGYHPDQLYGSQPAHQVDLWGLIAGDKTWRKSAFVLKDMLR
jgi:hypothetical protein